MDSCHKVATLCLKNRSNFEKNHSHFGCEGDESFFFFFITTFCKSWTGNAATKKTSNSGKNQISTGGVFFLGERFCQFSSIYIDSPVRRGQVLDLEIWNFACRELSCIQNFFVSSVSPENHSFILIRAPEKSVKSQSFHFFSTFLPFSASEIDSVGGFQPFPSYFDLFWRGKKISGNFRNPQIFENFLPFFGVKTNLT